MRRGLEGGGGIGGALSAEAVRAECAAVQGWLVPVAGASAIQPGTEAGAWLGKKPNGPEPTALCPRVSL